MSLVYNRGVNRPPNTFSSSGLAQAKYPQPFSAESPSQPPPAVLSSTPPFLPLRHEKNHLPPECCVLEIRSTALGPVFNDRTCRPLVLCSPPLLDADAEAGRQLHRGKDSSAHLKKGQPLALQEKNTRQWLGPCLCVRLRERDLGPWSPQRGSGGWRPWAPEDEVGGMPKVGGRPEGGALHR